MADLPHRKVAIDLSNFGGSLSIFNRLSLQLLAGGGAGNKVSSVLMSSTVFQRTTMDPPASTFQQKVAHRFTLGSFIQKDVNFDSNFIGKNELFSKQRNCIT
jgi:hypothetical protein